MIALDTNLLVRYVTQDDASQLRRVERILEGADTAHEDVLIPDIVVCELVWVLRYSYEQSREEVASVVERLLRVALFKFESRERLWLALGDYRSGKGDLSDYLVGRVARGMGASVTYTFDGALKNSDLFKMA